MSEATRRSARLIVPIALSGAAVFTASGVALAVSGGGYSPSSQGCSPNADANDVQGAQPGCHNMNILVQDGNGNTYAEAGVYQEAQGDNPHQVGFAVNPSGKARPNGTDDGSGVTGKLETNWQPFTGSCGLLDELLTPVYVIEGGTPCTDFQPQPPAGPPAFSYTTPNGSFSGDPSQLTSGRLYFGADDNLDTGEHDAPDGTSGSNKAWDGPSDGGAIQILWHPAAASTYATDVQNGNITALLIDPVRVASASTGACADGICAEGTTRRQVVYQGGSKSQPSRDVYDYPSKPYGFDPYGCSSGSQADERQCAQPGGPQNENEWYYSQGTVYAEPGVQVYEDPDPNGSPALPNDQPNLYPLPAAYVGTCGVTLDATTLTGGQLPRVSQSTGC